MTKQSENKELQTPEVVEEPEATPQEPEVQPHQVSVPQGIHSPYHILGPAPEVADQEPVVEKPNDQPRPLSNKDNSPSSFREDLKKAYQEEVKEGE